MPIDEAANEVQRIMHSLSLDAPETLCLRRAGVFASTHHKDDDTCMQYAENREILLV